MALQTENDLGEAGPQASEGVSRRGFFGGAVAGVAIAHELAGSKAWAQTTPGLPQRGEFVIRGGYVFTADPVLGDLPVGDVHVRNGQIIAVGANLVVAPGVESIDARRMIVMPGLIDTHWHVWNSLQRNWLVPEAGYMATKVATAKFYTATDFYNSERLAFAEALNAGVTSVYNYAHNVISPAYAAAELKAHQDSGIRGIYAYGKPDSAPSGRLIDATDVRRMHGELGKRTGPDTDLVKLGLNVSGPNGSDFDSEMRLARDLGIPVIYHGGQQVGRSLSTAALKAKGYLTPDLTIVHSLAATQEDRDNMAQNGVSLSWTAEGELHLLVTDPGGQLLQMVHSGVNVGLSFDGNSISPIDLFSAMSVAWDTGSPKIGTPTEKLAQLNFRQCIQMVTMNGARALRLEKVVGSLTPGKRADIILVRADDLNMAPFGNVDCSLVRSARAANVDTVIVDGRVMKRAGRLVGVNVQAVTQAAAASAFAIRQRAGGRFAPPAGAAIPSF